MKRQLHRRVINKGFALLDQFLSTLYRTRHPGAFERQVLRVFGFLIRHCQPNDRWNLHVFVPIWLQALRVAQMFPLPQPKNIFIFCVYRGTFTIHLVLAILLAWRGHRVTIGYIPKLQSPTKAPLVDHPHVAEYLRAALSGVEALSGKRILCVDLQQGAGEESIDDAAIEKQAHYDTVMTYGKEGLDFGDPLVRALKEHMIALGRNAQRVIRSHFRDHSYDVSIVGNGTTFEGSHACRILVEKSMQVNTTEKFAFRGVRVINHGGNFLQGNDIGLIWNMRERLGYTQGSYLEKFIEQAQRSIRERSENSTETWLWELQRAVGQTAEEAMALAGLQHDRPFILLLTNVVFDAGYSEITNVFSSMKQWMFETIRYLLDNSDELIVVRAHPGEGLYWAGKEPVHEVLAREGIFPSERLIIIPGHAMLNTYHLMRACRFGVVFTSSTGLEMAAMGKEVVTGGNVIYTQRGITRDASCQEEYYRNLQDLLDQPGTPALSEEKRRLALLFYFTYHWVTQYPYPYDKPTGIARQPPLEMLSTRNMAPYLPYLDLIAMTSTEFADALPNYLSATQIEQRLSF